MFRELDLCLHEIDSFSSEEREYGIEVMFASWIPVEEIFGKESVPDTLREIDRVIPLNGLSRWLLQN